MTAATPIIGALLLGGGVHAWLPRRAGAPHWPLGVFVWGILGGGLWWYASALLGWEHVPGVLLAPALAGAALIVAHVLAHGAPARLGQPRDRATVRWAAVATLVTIPHVVAIGAVPAFGWDFRYIWGLKAKAIVLSPTHVTSWLAWSDRSLLHPDYPLLWPALLVPAVAGGGSVAAAAAAWQALLAAALAAACWFATAGAPSHRRALAAAVGAWSPVVFLPAYSGYAEPLLAFGLVVALGALARVGDGEAGALPIAVAAVAMLGLTKNEGLAAALAVTLAALLTMPASVTRWLALGSLPGLGWRALLAAHGIAGDAVDLRPAFLAGRLSELPGALWGAVTIPLGVVAVLWALALPALSGRELRAARVALGLFGLAVLGAYVAGTEPMAWRMATSLDRVLAAPLPATLTLALRCCASRHPRGGGPPSPAASPG